MHWSVFLFRFVIYFWHLILITIRDPNMDLKVSLSCFSTIEQIGKKSRIRIPIHILYPDLFPEYRFCFLSGSGSWARSGPYVVFQTYKVGLWSAFVFWNKIRSRNLYFVQFLHVEVRIRTYHTRKFPYLNRYRDVA